MKNHLKMALALGATFTMGTAIAQSDYGSAREQGSRAQPTSTTTQLTSASATVKKVDLNKRELMLKDDQGDLHRAEAG
jgi:hypothetical protein